MDSRGIHTVLHIVARRAERWVRQGLLVALVVTAWGSPTRAVPAAPPHNPAAWNTFLEGLDSLREAKWAEAVDRFTAAQSNGIDDPQLILARGVAYALDRQFEPARADLSRGSGREAELWIYVIERMSGQIGPAHRFPTIRNMQPTEDVPQVDQGIPGHMIQGGNDYSTDYASFIYYEMAVPYSDARRAGTLDSAPGLNEAVAKAGRWVANRIASHREFAFFHYRRAEQLTAQRQYRDALKELTFAASGFPGDVDVLFLTAECWRAIGRPATARPLYTEVLTRKTDWAEAYLARAQTAAQMGDRRRVTSDLAVAAPLNAEKTAAVRGKIEALVNKRAVTDDPKTLIQELTSSALAGATTEELVPKATRLQYATEGVRKRYDEWYQDQVRQRKDAIKAKPDDSANRVSLARFLVDEVDNRFENVEPRRGPVPFRRQLSSSQELEQAVVACDAVLNRDARNVPALVTKAMALLELDRDQEAQRLVDRALDISGFDDPQALVLYAQFKLQQAGINQMRASALRMPTYTTSSHTEWRSDGLWKVTTTYRHDPSQSDLNQADALMAQAGALLHEAELAMQKAVRSTQGTLDGLLIESEYEFWYKSRQRAGDLLVQAVQKYPSSLKARDQLAWYFRWMGQYDNRIEAELAALNQVQTSAGPLLERIWQKIDKTGWRTLQKDLDRAWLIDPTDARAVYYRAVAYESQGQTDRAEALYRLATALEEARLQIDEPPVFVGKPLPRPAGDFTLVLGARLRLAQLIGPKHPQEALKLLEANAAVATRLPPGGLAEPMFAAMCPDPKAHRIPVPTPKNMANLLARSHLQTGKLLASLGRSDEAIQAYTAAAGYGRRTELVIPNIGTGKGDNNFDQYAGAPAAEAQIEIARVLIQRKQWDQAYKMLQDATQNGPPQEMNPELNKLFDQVVQVQNERQQQQAAREYAKQQAAMNAKLEADRRQAQERQNLRRSGAPVDPQLVGTWKTSPEDNPSDNSKSIQFSVRADGTYTWTEGGQTTGGTIQGWNTRVTLTPAGGAPLAEAYRYLPAANYGPGAGGGSAQLQVAFFSGKQYHFKKTD